MIGVFAFFIITSITIIFLVKKRTVSENVFAVYLMYCLLAESVFYFNWGEQVLHLMDYSVMIEYALLALYIGYSLKGKKNRFWIVSTLGALSLVTITIGKQTGTHPNLKVQMLLLAVLSGWRLVKVMWEDSLVPTLHNPMFWILLGMFNYFCCSSIVFFIAEYVDLNQKGIVYQILYYSHPVLNILAYLFYTIGLVWRYQKRSFYSPYLE